MMCIRSKMRNLVQESFWKNLLVMRLCGLYPPEKYKSIYKLYACFMYLFFVVPVPTLTFIYFINDKLSNVALLMENAHLTIQVGSFIIKLLPFIYRPDSIRKTIYTLTQPIFNKFTQEQEYIINDSIRVSKGISWFFLICCEVSWVGYAFKPLFSNIEYKLPSDIWVPFQFNNTKVYTTLYIYVSAGVYNVATSNGLLDPLIAGIACHIAAQVKILKNNLETLAEYVEDEQKKATCNVGNEKKSLKSRIMLKRIYELVDHHNAILDFVNLYEDTFSSVVFTQFTTSILVICISCYQLSKEQPSFMAFAFVVVYLITMVAEIYLYSYYGSLLYDESDSLINAVYMGKWYEYDIESRKALIILMERSKKPMIVTSGKILDLSLPTFAMIIRRAYSLLAVLKNY